MELVPLTLTVEVEEETILMQNTSIDLEEIIRDCLKYSAKDGLAPNRLEIGR